MIILLVLSFCLFSSIEMNLLYKCKDTKLLHQNMVQTQLI